MAGLGLPGKIAQAKACPTYTCFKTRDRIMDSRELPPRPTSRLPRPSPTRGLGAVALASLLDPGLAPGGRREPASRRDRPASRRPQGQARDLPLHGGRAFAPGDAGLQARTGSNATARRCPSRSPRGSRSRSCRDSVEVPRRRSIRSRNTASRVRKSARFSPPRHGCRRDLHRAVDGDGGDQPRPGPHVHEHGHDHLGPPEHGVVGHLRPRQRVGRPARIRRPDLLGPRRAEPADRVPPVAQRVPPQQVPGRPPPGQGRPGPVPEQPARRDPRSARGT